MSARRIDGRARAERLKREVAAEVKALCVAGAQKPGLAVILVGQDPASEIYVNNKIRTTTEVGMATFAHHLDEQTPEAELIALIESLNGDDNIHGILVQLPLPMHLDSKKIIELIAPHKDVDGFTLGNVGRLVNQLPGLIPCTPLGCLLLLEEQIDDFRGKQVALIGCSNVVGRPLIQLLLQRDCTVTVAHKHTTNTAELTRMADIVIVAAGSPGLVKGSWIKPGAVVIDVGINRIQNGEKTQVVGDVAFNEVSEVASAITPVPGGVGPMTIACLLANTLTAYRLQTQ
ncbi:MULTISPECIES: bifunctional methylenetetrahydrofolate dehydrogenase/methenyltetrahydrofolate cyclohydrolase FolD [unclassified Vibrio]|uniref:Bifunctional protein FolD n=1 Tax=Vibrio sp. HB236076 TaxID=3232307 RepID=A0AB39HBF1_9VIBR|nr:bifunctional methylenetetrahydrofolate dehydrogenase/methenyltetrahydrofolate cyclohydrolase FolD [Vibrio sp. HB161653]MDP5254455.1 bifunctional methylenetetrahydrofolate dehydrogenase/methenyltetrahydrofolate cyclohydrolase FolD [Vibrio sp. HB161653]